MTKSRIYVGTYAKYNNGSIAGEWVNLEDHPDKESFFARCAEIHKDERDPEYMFQDFERFPREFYGESGISDELWEWLSLDEADRELLSRYQDAIGGGYECTLDEARNAFAGTAASEAEFAEQMAETCGCLPKDIPNWLVLDWEATWNSNLRYDYITSTADDGRIWFFHNC